MSLCVLLRINRSVSTYEKSRGGSHAPSVMILICKVILTNQVCFKLSIHANYFICPDSNCNPELIPNTLHGFAL